MAAAALATLILFPTIACGGGEAPKATPTLSPYPTAISTSTATPTTAPAPAAVTVDLSNNVFTPNVLEVEAGKTARFVLIGDGEPHTFTIAKLGLDIPIPYTNTTTSIEFFVPSGVSGDLELVCEFHEVLGMVGIVRVK